MVRYLSRFLAQGRTVSRGGIPPALRAEYLLQPLLQPLLQHVIIHVTDRCNLRCKTCFVEFGRKDLSIEEARVLGKKLGYVPALDLGGGEPFLHRDLLGLCRAFRFGTVTIPTNGQFDKRVIEQACALAGAYPRRVTIAISLDGLEATNDRIRGAGTFEKSIATYRALREIPGLTVKVNTVVNNQNIDELLDLMAYVRELAPDYHSLLLLRGDPLAPEEVHLPDIARIRGLTPKIFEVLETYDYGHPYNSILRWLKASYQRYMWYTQLEILEKRRAPFQCKAAAYNKVIYPDGRASMCELKPVLGNLLKQDVREVNTALQNHLGEFEAAHGRCFCTHNCNISESIITHPPSILRVLMGGRP